MLKKSTVILGAGFTGLSAGYLLSKKGYNVIIIEQLSHPGGIGSEIMDSGNRYEMGAHLFHCPDKEIMEDIKSLVGQELININRTIKINFNGKYYDFPLKLHEILINLPFTIVLRAGFSFIFHKLKSIFSKNKNDLLGLLQSYNNLGIVLLEKKEFYAIKYSVSQVDKQTKAHCTERDGILKRVSQGKYELKSKYILLNDDSKGQKVASDWDFWKN